MTQGRVNGDGTDHTARGPPLDAEDYEMNNVDEARAVHQQRSRASDEIPDDVQLVDWTGADDPENPFNWPRSRKVLLTVVALIGTLTVLINGTSITVAAEDINAEFGISDANFPNSYWPIASWTIGGGLFMLVFLPIMEDVGVRWGYLISYAVFVISIIPQALARNFATLIIVRFFAGGCVSLIANAVSSIICDIWEGDKGRAVPMSVYITLYLIGSTIGPVIGGAILQFLHWRWILYIQLIFYGSLMPVFYLVIRETRGPIILKTRAKAIRTRTGKKAYTHEELHGPALAQVLRLSVTRPLYMLGTEWVVFSFTLWSSFSVGLVYLFTQSVVQVFQGLYGWPAYSAGYVQGAVVIGEALGWLASLYQQRFYFASASRNTENPGQPIPEARLYASIPAALLGMAGGMFIYAWTSYATIPWIAPALGLGLVGFGINVVVIAIAEYVTDCYSKYAASAVAAVAFGENVFAGLLPLAAQSMYGTLGYQWASSLLAFLALALGCAPVVLLVWGRTIRERSPFMRKARYAADT